ncbi:fibronectin type III domain-containing protein [Plantibacter flavus]|uniref:fibronectin type III domain-containing protein n=1 Tax=Plantibacter flavus TaxID=150123 RepID=UPI003F17E9D2
MDIFRRPRRSVAIACLVGAAIAIPAGATAAVISTSTAPVTGELVMYGGNSSWYAGGQFVLKNTTSSAQDWSLSFTVPTGGFQNSSEWNIDATVQGDRVTLTPKQGKLAAGASEHISFGVSGDGSGTLSLAECDLDGSAVAGCSTAEGGDEDTQAPTVPGGLTADANDHSSVHVMWQHSSDNVGVAGYRVIQDGKQVKEVGATTRMTNITGLTADTEYGFAVEAFDAAGNVSERTAVATARTEQAPVDDTEAPERIEDAAAVATGARTVDLTWSTPKDNVGVTHYKIYNGVDNSKVTTVPGDATSATITGLNPETAYSFQIHSYDAAGNVSLSNIASVQTEAEAPVEPGDPSAPAAFTAIANSYQDGSTTMHRIQLGWTPTSAANRYEVHLDGKLAQTILVGADQGDAQKRFIATGTIAGTHTVKIRAQLADGTWSAFTPELTVTQ